jgi:hypothetical protein
MLYTSTIEKIEEPSQPPPNAAMSCIDDDASKERD